jgi:hypothetical protein
MAADVGPQKILWGAEGISGRVKFLLLAWAGMPKTSFRKNSDSPPKSFIGNLCLTNEIPARSIG